MAGGSDSPEVDPEEDPSEDVTALVSHVELALRGRDDSAGPAAPAPDHVQTLAALALYAPGNAAWRALGRLVAGQPRISAWGHWQAAAVLASGIRRLFTRIESTLLLDRLLPGEVYWRAILRYCAWGNLQAVLDEYVHNLAQEAWSSGLDDEALLLLSKRARDAIALRPSRYTAFDPMDLDNRLPFRSRFALRYGGRRVMEDDSRQPEIRNAFNSPFWPFVLATTSVGQEGIDFHWWCHAVTHWNTPTNPVDFEQREGRVHRYGGHAIRRNIAARHREAILRSAPLNPWQAAYELALDERDRLGEFAPHWVYPGPARIERHVAPYPLSSDSAKLDRLKADLALYRLTFGQPRQEDLLDVLKRRGVHLEPERADRSCIDLSPPRT